MVNKKLGDTEWVMKQTAAPKMVQNTDMASHLLSCPRRKYRRSRRAAAHKHRFELQLSKHCFCPPVPANERGTEAWDTARFITPQNNGCNRLQPKHFPLTPRPANRSHSSEASVVPPLSYCLFPLPEPVSSQPWRASLRSDPHVLQALYLPHASPSPESSFQQTTETPSRTIISPPWNDADW